MVVTLLLLRVHCCSVLMHANMPINMLTFAVVPWVCACNTRRRESVYGKINRKSHVHSRFVNSVDMKLSCSSHEFRPSRGALPRLLAITAVY